MRVLVCNAGSTSLKLRLVAGRGRVAASADLGPGDEAGLRRFLDDAGVLDAVGHRVVHGGDQFTATVVVDEAARRGLEALRDLAPIHNPPALDALELVEALRPGVPVVACFDTSFHASLPAAARSYALPAEWVAKWGLRRFGFHGISCTWAIARVREVTGRDPADLRVVVCHLGGGASVTAVSGGRSVDTTMGFTPVEGLVMATRPGDVDPGAIAYIVGKGVGGRDLEDGLERRSGLVGLAGTADMRSLLDRRAAGDEQAAHAIEVYLHRLRAKIAAMAAALEGMDVLVFTGGVGERAAGVRAETCDRLGWLGVRVDARRNEAVGDADATIGTEEARVETLVVHSREELVIAAECQRLLSAR